MPDLSSETPSNLLDLVRRMRSGDAAAKEELAAEIYQRLEMMSRKMLRQAPRAVNRWEQTGDLLHNAWFRVERVLADDSVELHDEAHLFRMLARHVRFQLIDLYRSHVGAHGNDVNNASVADLPDQEGPAVPALDPQDQTYDLSGLLAWGELHQEVEKLPEQQKVVTDLIWYQELSQTETAELLGVSTKTVQRAWRRARIQLGKSLENGPIDLR